MKYSIALLLAIFSFGVIKAENCNRDIKISSVESGQYLKYVILKYKERTIVGLIFTDSIYAKMALPVLKLKSYCSPGAFGNKEDSRNDTLLLLAEKYLGKLDAVKREKVINRLEVWLKNDLLLTDVLNNNLNENVVFEEIIDAMPETKILLNKYLKDPKQYWGSLDSNQSCKLYFDVLEYLLTLDDKKRVVFFKKYFIAACDIALKGSK